MEIINVGSRIMNTYLYLSREGYVMVDTGYEHSYKDVLRRMAKKGIAPQDVKYVFLTHAHDDHAGFLCRLMREHPHINCIASESAVPVLERGQNSFEGGCSSKLALLFCKLMALLGNGEHRFSPLTQEELERFILVSEGETQCVENLIEGKIIFTPGHTADSLSLMAGNVIFCGDAAMNGFPSLNKITIWVEDKKAFGDSWEKIISEKDALIYPAHGKPFGCRALQRCKSKIPKLKLYKLKAK